jgi:hypothetical protein
MIYNYVFLTVRRQVRRKDYDFCRAIGNPRRCGFYFGNFHVLLRVNRQVYLEVLPLAYRQTTFILPNVEELMSFLIAVGPMDWDNIESLRVSWVSNVDQIHAWRRNSNDDDDCNYKCLPAQNVLACVRLLKNCVRLDFLHLEFDHAAMANLSGEALTSDPGISLLCSIKVEVVQVSSISGGSFDADSAAQWLKRQIER